MDFGKPIFEFTDEEIRLLNNKEILDSSKEIMKSMPPVNQKFFDPDKLSEQGQEAKPQFPDAETTVFDMRLLKGENEIDLSVAKNYIDFVKLSIKNMVDSENEFSERNIQSKSILESVIK